MIINIHMTFNKIMEPEKPKMNGPTPGQNPGQGQKPMPNRPGENDNEDESA